MAKIFAYKGYIGINGWKEGFPENLKDNEDIKLEHLTEALCNDPLQPEQLGFVCYANKCEFSQEALDLLKTIKPSRDAIGDIDIFNSNDGVIFCWLGGILRLINPNNVSGSRDYDPELLPDASEVEVPQDFKDCIDGLEK